jgi:NADPH2:quinone reductase
MQMEAYGSPDQLRPVELPDPEVKAGEVGIEVKAAACNFFDVLLCAGKYQQRPEPPFSPGGEVAGVVTAVGEGVTRVRAGDRVYAALPYGGFATKLATIERRVFPIPDAMSFEDAAAFGIVYQTAWFGLVERAALREGETLLVHAAAGGVGLAAVQVGRALGARVIGVAGGADKKEVVAANGADVAIDHRAEDWVARVREATDGRGVDVVFDPVGGDTFDLSTKVLAFDARLVVIGFASGRIPEIAMNRVLLKNVAVTGLHWGLYFEHDAPRVQRAMEKLYELWSAKKLVPLVSETRPFEEAASALEAIAARKTVGKIVLVP